MNTNPFFKKLIFKEIAINDDYRFKESFKLGYNFDYFIDIGANIGYASQLFTFLYPNANIIAVEPVPSLIEIYKNNMPHDRYTILNNCISDGSSLYFKFDSNNPNLGVTVCSKTKSDGDTEIKGITLKELLDKVPEGKKVCVKSDCEGGENFFLNEDNLSLFSKIDLFSLEVHHRRQRHIIYELSLKLSQTHDFIVINRRGRVLRKKLNS